MRKTGVVVSLAVFLKRPQADLKSAPGKVYATSWMVSTHIVSTSDMKLYNRPSNNIIEPCQKTTLLNHFVQAPMTGVILEYLAAAL
jgi:hypothetical protein